MTRFEADRKQWWQHAGLILAGALAGGLGWGIRGQYGHETGAMMAGLLVAAVIALGYLRQLPALWVARAMALATIGMGIGGSETYGQTLGLTHDPQLVGNWSALGWGLIGTAVKGAVWIGFAGLFLGIALGGRSLGGMKMLGLVIAMLLLHRIGIYVFNEPFDPPRHTLPHIYFSADWYWLPGDELKPRREVWGGLWLALLLPALWLRVRQGDRLAWRLMWWGILGGAIGFPAGQSLQAYHAWNRELFSVGIWEWLDPKLNWWNIMETTFGFIMGGCLTIGIMTNRSLIFQIAQAEDTEPESISTSNSNRAAFGSLASDWLEAILLIAHLYLLINAEFGRGGWYGDGLILAALPLVGVALGRYWPYWLMMPVVVIPIAGKTYRRLVIEQASIASLWGAILYLILPVLLMTILAVHFSNSKRQCQPSLWFTPGLLLAATWVYFCLNYAFFEYPLPWHTWTTRTPNSLYYALAAFYLTSHSFWHLSRRRIDSHVQAS